MTTWGLILLLTLPAAGAEPTDDPMIRWDCDRAGNTLALEMVRPPLSEVTAREQFLFSGAMNFVQCYFGKGTWTLLVDIVEYDAGRCEPEPDTIVSLLRGEKLVISRVPIGNNCGDRPVLSALKVSEDGDDPRLELCTAQTYGAESHCSQLRFERIDGAIDGAAIAAHARNAR